MQELFSHPIKHLGLHFLNACEVWRRENKEAKFEEELLEHKLKRCFGICRNKNRKF